MHCGKATSQEGKDVHVVWFREVCIVNKGGIECCTCARTSPSYSRLSDPTSDDRKMGAPWERGLTDTWDMTSKRSSSSKRASSPRPPSQPNTFFSYCFPSSTADG